jgi:hypothetical protein
MFDARSAPHDFQTVESPAGITYVARAAGCFRISADGRLVEYELVDDADLRDVQYLLTGPVACLAFQLQGEPLLHAVGLEVPGGVIALAGQHAAGKSTLAAFFQRNGVAVLTDDVLPLRESAEEVLARQGVPWIKLGPDTLDVLGERPEDFPLVRTSAAKRKYPRTSATEGTVERPLRAVYELAPQDSPGGATEFAELTGSDAVFALLSNTYSAATLTGHRARAAFDFATRLAGRVRVRRVTYHRSYEHLPALCDAILRDAEGVAGRG